jgi:hypothetical protein
MRFDLKVSPTHVVVIRNGTIGEPRGTYVADDDFDLVLEQLRLFLHLERNREASDRFRSDGWELAYTEVWVPVEQQTPSDLEQLARSWFAWLQATKVYSGSPSASTRVTHT